MAENLGKQGLFRGGADQDRTDDLLNAIQALSQLSYSPTGIRLVSQGEAYSINQARNFLKRNITPRSKGTKSSASRRAEWTRFFQLPGNESQSLRSFLVSL
jgi:hypothetical protein